MSIFTKQDWKIGAIYRFAKRQGAARALVVKLLVGRAGLSERKADQLATHWKC